MKLNLKSTITAPADNKSCQKALNGIIGNTRRGIVIDKTLDPDSNNPVANKPVSTALAALAGKIDAALQRPTGLTKTKLVGVGTNGQENIEIGDNLTLANGKLFAMGGGSNVNILVGSEPEESDNGYTGTYSGVPDTSKINILHIPDFADFVLTFSTGGGCSGYVSEGEEGANFIIMLFDGNYTIKLDSGSSGVAFDVITLSSDETTYTGTITGERPILIKATGTTILPIQSYNSDISIAFTFEIGEGDSIYLNMYFLGGGQVQNAKILIGARYYSHFITMTNSTDNVSLYLTIQNTNEAKFDSNTLASYLAGKKVLANGNLHGVVPTYIAGEGGVIKIYYRTPGDSNINPTPDEYQDLFSFSISELVTPVD